MLSKPRPTVQVCRTPTLQLVTVDLWGGKTVFVSPNPERTGEGVPGEEHNRERPMVIAVPRPGRPSSMTEWMKSHAGELDEARDWEETLYEG